MNNRLFQKVSLAACLLALVVIVLGAYVRLSDAGLGCPDWPGCFGQITAPDEAQDISRARIEFPDKEVHSGKAWKEMVHRYFASTLGFLILIMAFLAWKNRLDKHQQLKLPLALVALVIFQGMLGMWTVTQMLRPTIVTLHLITGLLTLGLLFWVFLKHSKLWVNELATNTLKTEQFKKYIKPLAKIALVVLAFQIFLGGWTSTNYVALYCPDFPTCQGSWWPQTNFSDAFVFFRDPSVNYEGGTLSLEAGVAVHYSHRIGALLATIVISFLAVLILLNSGNRLLRNLSILLLTVLTAQVSLGIANVMLVLPIPVAVSHNAMAAVLLLTLILINYSLGISSQKAVSHVVTDKVTS